MGKKLTKNSFNFIHSDVWVCLLLVLAILAVYWQVRRHTFLNFDDPAYVTENAYVKKGLTLEGLQWAFSLDAKNQTYWHPLTWLSHMLDVELHDMKAGSHLMTNVLLHIFNSVLLFYILRGMTGAFWPSAFIAMLFAVHPLNVEAVAWVTERKSVLSTFFWMLTLLAYYVYAKHQGFGRYLLVVSMFTLGLMAKPMLVTLPFVFLVLDYWPLKRLKPGTASDGKVSSAQRLVVEKIPLFLIAAASIYISSLSLHRQGNFIPMTSVPMELRIGNALVSYVNYIIKMILPVNLSVYYPYPEMLPVWQPAGALLILVGITVAVIRHYRDRPYLLMGWLWYLGTLFPVLGLVQAGVWPAMADRFVYVPMIGVFLMIAWGGYDLSGRQRYPFLGPAAAAAVILSLMVATGMQVGHWKNSIVLFEQALRVNRDNALAHNNLGVALRKQGKLDDAIFHYDAALILKPDYPAAHNNLGLALMRIGQIDEAVVHFRQALQMKPLDNAMQNSLQQALNVQDAMNAKIAELQSALQLTPEDPMLHCELGDVYERNGATTKAIEHYKKALALRPDFSKALNHLAIAYAVRGDYQNALYSMKQLITLQPENPVIYYSIASVLARQNKVDESIEWLRTAIRKGFHNKDMIRTDKNLENLRNSKKYTELLDSF